MSKESRIKRAQQMKAAGYTNADIAKALGISESTVRLLLKP